MRLSGLLMLIAAAATTAVAVPAAAYGQPYAPVGPTVTVSDSTVVVGDTVEVTGTGFGAGEPITITVSYQTIGMGIPRGGRSVVPRAQQLAQDTARANADGTFRHRLTLTTAGRALITATGVETGRSGSATVLVLTSHAELPTTGASSGTYLKLLAAGLAATVLGVALVAVGRRRRRTTT
jgi:LPXTG-motif cell wall-anchored protein